MGLSTYSARVLMLACCAARLVTKDEKTGKYFNSALAEKVLVSSSRNCMTRFVQFNYQVQQRCSTHLTQSLRENRNAGLGEFPGDGGTLYERLAGYPQLERLFQDGMGQYTRLSPAMMEIEEFGHVKRLLDVGGGDGSNAIRLCRQYPALRVTIAEIPSVVEIAGSEVKKAGLTDRIDCIVRDMFSDPLPNGFDAVLLSHVVEIFAPEKILFLYRKVSELLTAGGRLFVWTIMANDSECGGLQAAKSSIYFLSTASGEGMAYPGSDHERWLREAGFSTVKRYNAPAIDHGGIVAAK
jgi:2-polyprenyl-3-methyl-5-hydroxy-6-metoxy-1,4-benzoquinol methylase